jgi:PAS domain S-box-containing protein
MRGQNKTRGQLINELNKPSHRIFEESHLEGTRKQTEEALRESENYYRTLIQNLPPKIFLKDKNSVYLSCNEHFSRDLKMRPAEIAGKTDYDFYPKELAEKFRADDRRIMETGKTGDTEEKFIQDGMEMIIHKVKAPVKDEEGRAIGILGIFWDITESKHADDELKKYREHLEKLVEERTAELRNANEQLRREITVRVHTEEMLREYQKAIEGSKDMIAVVDRNYNYILANNAFLKYRGMGREQVVGRSVPELLGKDVFESVIKKNLDTCFQGKVVQYEMKYPYPESGERDLLVAYFPIEGPDGVNRVASVIRDITELKQIVNELQTEKQRFQTLSENAPFGMVMIDKTGTFRYMNPKFGELFGYDLNDVPDGRTWFRKAYPDPTTRHHVISTWVNDLRSSDRGEKRPRTFTVTCKDGTEKIINFTPVQLETGENLMACEDITERKQAEEILRESEEKYRTILENIQDGYFEVDLAGNFTFVNDVVCRRLGYSREELIGMNNRQYTDETTAKKVYQLYNRIYRTGEPVKNYEEEVIRKDGTIVIYELSVSLIRNPEGKPIGFRGISRDITERKRAEEALRQSEERYRTILESIEDGYYEVDLGGDFTFLNDSMCQIFGYPREELMGMNNRQYTDQETMRKLFQAFNEVYRTGKRSRVFDYEIIRKDGAKRHVEASISLRKDASGNAICFRGIIRDITDKKRIEEQLFQAEKLRAVGEMASGVAHDFNNALAAILGNTQILLYTAQDEGLKGALKIIEKVAKDSSQTVRRLQDFTRKPVPQELFKVDINAIVKDSIEITKPKWKDEAQSRGIRIEMVSNLEDIPLASGNASELREVFTNIIFNAIEAMHEGGKIEIRTFKKRRDVFIQISDTGVGIAEEAKRRIFEPFFTTKPFTNTGLGLSMSYGIVKRFGGEIEVESKVGQGTAFTITLPIGEDEKEEAVEPQPIKKGRSARILVIDDDEFVRSVLSRTLVQADHQVTLAEDGEKGVQLFKEGKFDVVLTDLGMPGVSGWEVCRMIKKISPHTPVGMVTGWGDEKDRSKMEEYGLDFFISKPFDFAQILNVVAETMESRKE